MRNARPAVALDPRRFGRRALALSAPAPSPLELSEDARLFLSTFAAGFLVVSMLII